MSLELILPSLIEDAKSWVKRARDSHRPSARGLADDDRSLLRVHFDDDALDLARFREVSRIENPEFLERVQSRGIPVPYDFSTNRGICFVDTILTSDTFRPPTGRRMALLFHQLVHVVQYQLLGLDRFIEQYLRGWVHSGFEYHSIPAEKEAYDLQDRFERGDVTQLFRVRGLIERRILDDAA